MGIEKIVPKFADVIKYEGGNDTFIWKHPAEDFNIGSQLIVHESQEAIFFLDGQAFDTFGPGKYTLDSMNLPIIGKFVNAAMGGDSPFHCEVYFINKTEQLSIKWGTDSKLEYIEPEYGFPIQLGASGEMSLKVTDSRKLLINVVGTERGLTQVSFVQKMRGFLVSRTKNYLSSFIKKEKINIFEIDEHLLAISKALHESLKPDFTDYGISLERFFITTVVKPEEDSNYRRFKELHFRQYADVAEAELRQKTDLINQETQKQRMIIEAEALAQKRELEGYTYRDERSFDVAERMASNEAVGQMANMGIGLGVMTGVGVPVGNAVGDIMHEAFDTTLKNAQQPQETSECPKCNTPLPSGAKFCFECGGQVLNENELICSVCGAKTPKGKFCLECGSPNNE